MTPFATADRSVRATPLATRHPPFPLLLLSAVNYIVGAEVVCPYCGETFPTSVDTSQGDVSTIEDCTVCCRPISLNFECEPGEVFSVEASRA